MGEDFRDVMARLPAGVSIVTTHDADGAPQGLTVSSFCSVSLDPPLVLVCIAKSARCFPVFLEAEEFAVSVLRAHHADLARRFASSGADKFGAGGFVRTARGGVVVGDALASLECTTSRLHDAGDHVIVVGEVVVHRAASGSPAVYFNRRFTELVRHG